ncbi:Phosphatidylinositol 3,4,5-Trisphosphate 5-Phosphatase 2 [Manis pentadactyla]|nr:Phosphatidylinositol 3,4,5-Trisphosphate 5-Phosphatase 2 [Manis pentadactyla]
MQVPCDLDGRPLGSFCGWVSLRLNHQEVPESDMSSVREAPLSPAWGMRSIIKPKDLLPWDTPQYSGSQKWKIS